MTLNSNEYPAEERENYEGSDSEDEGDWSEGDSEDEGGWDGMEEVDVVESTPTSLPPPQKDEPNLFEEMLNREKAVKIREKAGKIIIKFLLEFISRKRTADRNLLEEYKARKQEDQLKYERIILAEKVNTRRFNIPCKDAGVMCETCPWCKEMLAFLDTFPKTF